MESLKRMLENCIQKVLYLDSMEYGKIEIGNIYCKLYNERNDESVQTIRDEWKGVRPLLIRGLKEQA